jgi:hypothetical protein
MTLTVGRVLPSDQAWLRGVTEFLLRGMRDLQEEFPGEIVIEVKVTEV